MKLKKPNLTSEYSKHIYVRQEVNGRLGISHVKAQANVNDRSKLLKGVEIKVFIIRGEADYLVDKYGALKLQRVCQMLNCR